MIPGDERWRTWEYANAVENRVKAIERLPSSELVYHADALVVKPPQLGKPIRAVTLFAKPGELHGYNEVDGSLYTVRVLTGEVTGCVGDHEYWARDVNWATKFSPIREGHDYAYPEDWWDGIAYVSRPKGMKRLSEIQSYLLKNLVDLRVSAEELEKGLNQLGVKLPYKLLRIYGAGFQVKGQVGKVSLAQLLMDVEARRDGVD